MPGALRSLDTHRLPRWWPWSWSRSTCSKSRYRDCLPGGHRYGPLAGAPRPFSPMASTALTHLIGHALRLDLSLQLLDTTRQAFENVRAGGKGPRPPLRTQVLAAWESPHVPMILLDGRLPVSRTKPRSPLAKTSHSLRGPASLDATALWSSVRPLQEARLADQ